MKNKVKQSACGAVMIGLSLVSLPALAQDSAPVNTGEEISETPAAEGKRLPITVDVGGSYQAQSDIDKGGDFSISRFLAGVGLPVRFNDQFALATTAKFELASFDFGGSAANAWDTIDTLTLVSLLQYHIDDKWSVYGGPIVRVSAESGANFSKGWSGGGAAACNYRVNDTLTVGGGFVAVSQIEDDPLILPIVTVNWRFADEWKLLVGFNDLATAGYGAQVTYDMGDFWTFGFGGQFHKSRFRLDTADAIGQETAFIMSLSATYKFSDAIAATGYVGMATGGQLRVENSGGKHGVESDYDSTPIVGGKVSFKF